MKRSRPAARVSVIVALIAAIAAALIARDQLEPVALRTLLDELGPWASLAFIAAFSIATVAFVPGSIFGLAGGVLFGPLWGTVWNLAGGTLGATIAFLIARYLAGDWVTQKAGGTLQKILRRVDDEGWCFVALTRLVPAIPFNLLNYALGLTRIRLSEYVLATLICMTPGAAAYAWLGHAGRQAATGDADALRYGLLGLGMLALVLFLPGIVRRIRNTRDGGLTVDEYK